MSFSPRTYYVSVHTRFNIDADLFLLARVAATTAPSVNDVVTTGVHVQCKAEKTCSGVVSGLQPLTSYDVYYWYRSEAGAEPLSPITSMMQRVRTTDVVPFALSLEGVGAERDHVNVVVSMEERGGYVWCRVHEVDMVPTVEQFKLTTPLVLEDGAARGVKRVDDLRAGVSYFGYCYSEDSYGDVMTNSIASTRFAFTTRDDTVAWNTTVWSNATLAAVRATSNRNLTMCCVLEPTATPVDFAYVMGSDYCTAVSALVPTSLFMVAQDDTDYWVTCAARTSTFEELMFDQPEAHHTASRAPLLELVATQPTYHSLPVDVRSDRPGSVWCLAREQATTPTVEEVKEGAMNLLVRDAVTSVVVEGLEASTPYHVWCYGATSEGLPMQNALETMHAAVSTYPCKCVLRVS